MMRKARLAGSWYPASEAACRRFVDEALSGFDPPSLPREPLVGAIAPHAGWRYSGRLAARVIATIGRVASPKTILCFGAVHVPGVWNSAVFAKGAFSTPLGPVEVDRELASAISEAARGVVEIDPEPHLGEHSIEVLVPFIAALLPSARIVPILVPPSAKTVELGVACALAAGGSDVTAIASTDLTHYGLEAYGFAPAGEGEDALRWAKDENDRRFIDLCLKLDAESVVTEARERRNACGPGAVAALLAYARERGAKKGVLLGHSTSFEEETRLTGRSASAMEPDLFVGYAGIVFLAEGSTAKGNSLPPAASI